MVINENFKICEGVESIWHYHLHRADDSATKSLCGAQTMATEMKISSWGFKPKHMRSSYCKTCEDIASQEAKS